MRDTERMTDEQLAELAALDAASTPRPWELKKVGGYLEIMSGRNYVCGMEDDPADAAVEADATLIATARTVMPAMIAEVRKLRAALREIEEISDPLGIGYYEFNAADLTPETLAALKEA